MVVVAAFAASTAAGLFAAITVTWRRIRSATNAGSCSYRPSAQRSSIATLRPSTSPNSLSPSRNALTRCAYRLGDSLLRNPITGIAACCACAADGHTAAPATSVMNSRRLIVAPRGQSHALHRVTAVRVLKRAERDVNCDRLFWAANVGFGSHDRSKPEKLRIAYGFRFAPESGRVTDSLAKSALCHNRL